MTNGTWQITGAGSDIWWAADQFHYVWQPFIGDGRISTHVVSQTMTNQWAKAGVMLRQNTMGNSPFYAVFVTPGSGLNVEYRSIQGGNALDAAKIPGIAAPVYLRVSRVGSSYSAFTSRDGVNWTLIPGSTISMSMSGTTLRGLAVTSHNSSALSTGTFGSTTIG